MPLLSSILSMLKPQGVTNVTYFGDNIRTIVDGKDAGDLYEEQPHLKTVVDFLAQNVAQLTPKCYIKHDDADRERDTDGVLPRLLADPNPDMTTYDLIFETVADYSLYGQAIWLVGKDASSASGWQIRPIPPAWVKASGWVGGDGFHYDRVRFADMDNGGGIVEVPTSMCVIFNSYYPGKPAKALSPVESLKATLAEQMQAQAYRRSVWDNATRISGFISRPAGVKWSDAAFARFKKDMNENWAKGGASAGKTPVLEDGMRYETVTFNAHEADWASGVQLSREDVAAAYHVNPAMIWNASGQTYASAKDNARSLYADTLMPLLTMLQSRMTKRLVPMLGADSAEYVEFDITGKLAGSFEEQASAMQSSVGAPWMTREEARVKMGLPSHPNGDLVTPLNVLIGGLASPNDTAPKSDGFVMEPKEACDCASCKSLGKTKLPKGIHAKAEPTEDEEESIADALRSFYRKQRAEVLAELPAKRKDGVSDWWDSEKWDEELAETLQAALVSNATAAAKRALRQLGIDPALYDEPRTRNYLKVWARSRAGGINATTLRQLQAALDGDLDEDAEGSTPEGVFDKAETSRAAMQATTIATQIAAWGSMEAARQCAPESGALKTWERNPSREPRESHRRLDGQTVPIEARFSNGADWPGDSLHLKASEVANCHCGVTLTIPDGDD